MAYVICGFDYLDELLRYPLNSNGSPSVEEGFVPK